MIEIKSYRNEWKYLCSENTLSIIENRVSAFLKLDKYSEDEKGYEVHSLYFDDLRDGCVYENDAGVSERFKYRIRYYGDNQEFIRLERKEKLAGRCRKEQCILTLEEYNMIVNGDADELYWKTNKRVLKEFCVYCMTKHYTPKIIVNYNRRAYVEDISNIRITFDRNIAVSDEVDFFLNDDYTSFPLNKTNMQVLEVKFDSILPSYLRHAITCEELVQTSFSKYYQGRIMLKKKGY